MKPRKSNLKFEPHPLSFLVPGEMSEEEISALAASIKQNGLKHPIVLFEGKILDGRARYAACLKCNEPLRAEEYNGKNPEMLVLQLNLHRRQLNSMQKGIVAAKMTLAPWNMTQREAYANIGISPTTLNLALKLLDSKNALLIKRCERGDATRAEVVEMLDEDQHAPAPTGNVLSLGNGSGVVGSKRPATTRPVETKASKIVAQFRKLSTVEQKHFVEMAWTWLAPSLRTLGYLPKQAKVVVLPRRKRA